MTTRHHRAAAVCAVLALCITGGAVTANAQSWEPGPAEWRGGPDPDR